MHSPTLLSVKVSCCAGCCQRRVQAGVVVAARLTVLFEAVCLMGCSDMSTFFDDISSVRPTVLMLIPRISNMCARFFLPICCYLGLKTGPSACQCSVHASAEVIAARLSSEPGNWVSVAVVCGCCRMYDQFQGQLQKVQHMDSNADLAKLKQVS